MRRLAHLVARLLPQDLRQAYGDDLRRDIDRRCREGRAWSTLTDVIAAVVRERRSSTAALPALPRQHSNLRLATMIMMLFQDARYALRLFARQPAFTLAVILTLGLGIGSSTAVLSLADATLLRPISAHEPDRLAQVPWSFSYQDFQEFRRRAEGFDGVLAFSSVSASLDTGDTTERLTGALVSGNYFSVLGISPAVGRLLSDEDDQTTGAPSIVVSHRLWQASFGGDPSVVGRAVRVNGRTAVIVGVVTPGFRGISLANLGDVWMPVALAPHLATGVLGNPRILEPNYSWLDVVGRLSPGVTMPQAAERLSVL